MSASIAVIRRQAFMSSRLHNARLPTEEAQYRVARAEIAAIEKHLWQHMHAAGMDMLNQYPACKAQHNPKIFKLVQAAFTPLPREQNGTELCPTERSGGTFQGKN